MQLLKPLTTLVLTLIAITASAGFPEEFVKRYPDSADAKFAPAFSGFWSVTKNGEVVFVSDDLSIAIHGDVVDLRTNRSLTAAAQAANRPAIDPANSFAVTRGSRKLYVFADPDCGYCRKLQHELHQVADVEIRILPFTLGPRSEAVAERIWCSPDPGAAWDAYLTQNVEPPSGPKCATPFERVHALGQAFGVRGTPALVFEDGTVVPGWVNADRINAMLNGTKGGRK